MFVKQKWAGARVEYKCKHPDELIASNNILISDEYGYKSAEIICLHISGSDPFWLGEKNLGPCKKNLIEANFTSKFSNVINFDYEI